MTFLQKKRLANTVLFRYNMDVALTRQRIYADVAQSVEHLIGNEEVDSSNLFISSKSKAPLAGALLLELKTYLTCLPSFSING